MLILFLSRSISLIQKQKNHSKHNRMCYSFQCPELPNNDMYKDCFLKEGNTLKIWYYFSLPHPSVLKWQLPGSGITAPRHKCTHFQPFRAMNTYRNANFAQYLLWNSSSLFQYLIQRTTILIRNVWLVKL